MALTVTHEEMKSSPNENWTYEQFTAVRKLKVAWADRFELMAELLTFPGHDYPHRTGAGITCKSASSTPFARETGASGYTELTEYPSAIVTANYSTPRAGDPRADGISQHIESTAEFRTLNPAGFSWGEDGRALYKNEMPGQQVHGLVYVFTRHNALQIPASVLALSGTVNADALFAQHLGLTFAKETLLFKPPSIDSTTNVSGQETHRITYRFLVRPQSWNKYWVASFEKWEEIWTKNPNGPGRKVYKNFPPADWSGI